MEISTNITFSGDLIENQETTITYSGYLFQNNSTSLKIVYGFGDNWMYTHEKEMKKTKNGFVATIKMLNFSKFNFCFKNANNEWDNNYNSNFVAPISEFKINEEFILNENVIEDILTNLVQYDISKIETPKVQTISESVENYEIHVEPEVTENIQDIECESSEVIETVVIEDIEVEPIQNNEKVVEEIVNESISLEEDTSFEVYYEENEAIDISETIENEVLDAEINADLNKEFIDLYEDNSEETEVPEDVEQNTIPQFDINNLSTVFENFENIEITKDTTTVDNVVSDLVDNLYENSKKFEIEEKEKVSNLFESIFEDSDQTNEKKSDFHVVEEEESLIDSLNSDDEIEVTLAHINVEPSKVYKYGEELGLVVSPRSLNPFYALKKKVKIAFYKIFTAIPKMLSNNYENNE